MSILLQNTIKESVELEGVGLHNGIKANLCIKPAEANTGIKFIRTDVDSSRNEIEAIYKNVSSPILCTKIKNSHGISVSTIEHLMAAFYGEGIDNAIVEIDAPEVPIMDGSAFDFVMAIKTAGIEKQKIYSNSLIIALINSLFFFLIVYFVNFIFLDKFITPSTPSLTSRYDFT